ncbi:hypothetical protein H6F42_20425 [Pseudanabaena sp. FACHB-1998]|uniref:hypothetical protein n=1 Tax=Pseudanabaena sp. FACHB-1998 TaxID=2692858 RepID=UPI00168110BE|nr:hypothetical protein [Pseudanabaena sp. FACHB-1998]MBD2179293.1 hypothetical protein [Pseudanabaena sp. FACHB-1998]
MLKIRIFDSKIGSGSRGFTISQLAKKYNLLEYSLLASSWQDVDKTRLVDESSTCPNIFFIHISDQILGIDTPYVEFFNYIVETLPSSLVVIYSGGTLIKTETDEGFELNVDRSSTIWNLKLEQQTISNFCVIQYPVSNGNEMNLEMALEAYTLGNNKEEFFQILQGEKLEILPALSILCQGYLAVHTDFDNHEVTTALEKMGWIDFNNSSEYSSIISQDVLNKKSVVQQISWWLYPFAEMNLQGSSILDEIKKKIEKEWNEKKCGKVCDCILQLLDLLKGKNLEDPLIVARAYVSIANRLENKYQVVNLTGIAPLP